MEIDLTLVSGVLGLAGSVFLGVPAVQGLRDRRALDRALAAYRRDRAVEMAMSQGAQDAPQPGVAAVPSARDVYEADRDTILADAVGGFWSHVFWNVIGVVCLAAAFLALILSA